MKTKIYDAVIIGGGPSGMMAAGTAAERGLSVLLLEKNNTLGKKLLITGGGRCNVTNNKPDIRTMLAKYKGSDKFLFSAFSQFAVEDTLKFFNTRGMETKEELDGRMFPVSNTAQSVWDTLVDYLKSSKVEVRSGSDVVGVSTDTETKNILITLKNQEKIKTKITAKSCIIATGGTSRPETGSTGDGFVWLRKLGHTIVDNDFALVPVALSDIWAKKLGGVTLTDIKLTTFQNGVKQDSQKGKILFTHFGVSGPTILNMSRDIGELLQYGEVTISLDLFPSLDSGKVKEKLQALLVEESNKKIKNILGKLVVSSLVLPVLELAGIDAETPSHSVKSADRVKLALLLKAIPLNVSGLLGSDKAVVSSGGVVPEEVNFKTMESRLVPNIYIVGDMLNIDRPSGGYSLQLSWTTGYVAGNNCKV